MSNSRALVVGPAHCERHKAHVVGCLDCAYAVAEADDLDLDAFLDVTEQIGWERPDGW